MFPDDQILLFGVSVVITQGEHLQLREGQTVQSRQSQAGQDAQESRLTDGAQTKWIEVFEELLHLDTHGDGTETRLSLDRGEMSHPNAMDEHVMSNSCHQVVHVHGGGVDVELRWFTFERVFLRLGKADVLLLVHPNRHEV